MHRWNHAKLLPWQCHTSAGQHPPFPAGRLVSTNRSFHMIYKSPRSQLLVFSENRQCLLPTSCKNSHGKPYARHEAKRPPWKKRSPLKIKDWMVTFLLGRPMFGCYVSFRECIYFQVCVCFPAPHFSSRDHVPVDALYLKTSCISGLWSCGLLIPCKARLQAVANAWPLWSPPYSDVFVPSQIVWPVTTVALLHWNIQQEVNPDFGSRWTVNKREARLPKRLTSSGPTKGTLGTFPVVTIYGPYVQEITSSSLLLWGTLVSQKISGITWDLDWFIQLVKKSLRIQISKPFKKNPLLFAVTHHSNFLHKLNVPVECLLPLVAPWAQQDMAKCIQSKVSNGPCCMYIYIYITRMKKWRDHRRKQ